MKYIGENTTWHNLIPQQDQELVKDTVYNVEVKYDGPQVIINGQQVLDPNGTVWVIFDNGCSIPYAPNLLSKFWE